MGTLVKLILIVAVGFSTSVFAKPATKRKSVSLKLVLHSDVPKADAGKAEAVKVEAPKESSKPEAVEPTKTAEELPAAPVKPAKKAPKKVSSVKTKARAVAATPVEPTKRKLKKRERKPASVARISKPAPPAQFSQKSGGSYEKSSINFNNLIYKADVRQNNLEKRVKAKTADKKADETNVAQNHYDEDSELKWAAEKSTNEKSAAVQPRSPQANEPLNLELIPKKR